jgi:hypothetical protein
MSRSDRALLNAARRDLPDAPKVFGYGRADLLRSAPFRARYRGVCPRCRKRIDIGDDVRYHDDFTDPVHVGCREPSARTESGPTKPKPALLKEIPVCPSLLGEPRLHGRRLQVQASTAEVPRLECNVDRT